LTGHSAAKLYKICGTNNFKIANAHQAKMGCKFKNTKEKLFKTSAAVDLLYVSVKPP
jgi:hypothetical protein